MLNNKIHPDVNQLIQPIVFNMTKIKLSQAQQARIYGRSNEPDDIKLQKRSCVHIMYDGSGFALAARRADDGKLVCECCGREINTTFDDDAVNKITDALPVINQLLMFGMLHGMQRKPIENLIVIKNLLPDAAQMMKELCEFVKSENARASTMDNVGHEYQSDLLGLGNGNAPLTGLR